MDHMRRSFKLTGSAAFMGAALAVLSLGIPAALAQQSTAAPSGSTAPETAPAPAPSATAPAAPANPAPATAAPANPAPAPSTQPGMNMQNMQSMPMQGGQMQGQGQGQMQGMPMQGQGQGQMQGQGQGQMQGHMNQMQGHMNMHHGYAPRAVEIVQAALNNNGFKLDINGKMDKETRDALKQYQSQHKLKATGTIDHATVKSLGIKSLNKWE